jgi:hypothetical protein
MIRIYRDAWGADNLYVATQLLESLPHAADVNRLDAAPLCAMMHEDVEGR